MMVFHATECIGGFVTKTARLIVLLMLSSAIKLSSGINNEASVFKCDELGISMTLPTGLPVCKGHENSHCHGVTVFLDPLDSGACENQDHRRAIYIFSFFNVLEETKTLDGFLAWEYSEVLKGVKRVVPVKLKIDKLTSVVASVDRQDGWIDVVVLAQSGSIADRGNAKQAAAINHSVGLRTNSKHFKRDMKKFISLLSSVRIFEPQQ